MLGRRGPGRAEQAGPTAAELAAKSLAELHELAAERDVPRFRSLRREELIDALAGNGQKRPASRRAAAAEPLEVDELDELEAPVRPPITGGPADESVAERITERDLDHEDEVDERGEAADAEAADAEDVEAATDDQDGAGQEGRRDEPHEIRTGVLDLVPDGFGFMRVEGFTRSGDDVFVSRTQVRDVGLREGDELTGPVRPLRRRERHPSLLEVTSVNGGPVEELTERPSFDELTAVNPVERLVSSGAGDGLAPRMLELSLPLLKGQRAVVAGPAHAGATVLLREFARAAPAAGAVTPIVVLLDSRPEEVTEWRRAVEQPVHASASERSADAHVQFAALALARAKRLVERGEDVLLVIDSLTRLARAHALAGSGRRTRGDREPAADPTATAVQAVKRWFASARNTEEAGSLTIVGAVRAPSEAALDNLLNEALTDVSTAEARLDSGLAAAGRWPAIDVTRSFARAANDASSGNGEADAIVRLRNSLREHRPQDAWDQLAERIRETPSNRDLIASI